MIETLNMPNLISTDFRLNLMNGESLKKPIVSFVMPYWNAENTVVNAINSVINQTIDDWELIIVNDKSGNPYTLEAIVKNFNDKRIKIIHLKEHSGLAEARNKGIEASNSEIIITQDADDLSMPDRLEKCLEEFDNETDVLYHGAYVNFWDIKYNCIHREYRPALPVDRKRLLKEQYITGWPIFRKKVWEKKPFRIETQFCYDHMMYLDWVYSGFRLKPLNIGLYEYVRQENSASIRFEREGLKSKSMEKMYEIMKNEYGCKV